MISVYGLKTCDTCRAALKWLESEELNYRFFDIRDYGVNASTVRSWMGEVGCEALLNRRGTTWRGLSDIDKKNIDESKAISLMVEHPTLIKRPVFQVNETVFVGFKSEQKTVLIAGQQESKRL